MIHVGLSVRTLFSPAATDSSPMKLKTRTNFESLRYLNHRTTLATRSTAEHNQSLTFQTDKGKKKKLYFLPTKVIWTLFTLSFLQWKPTAILCSREACREGTQESCQHPQANKVDNDHMSEQTSASVDPLRKCSPDQQFWLQLSEPCKKKNK